MRGLDRTHAEVPTRGTKGGYQGAGHRIHRLQGKEYNYGKKCTEKVQKSERERNRKGGKKRRCRVDEGGLGAYIFRLFSLV